MKMICIGDIHASGFGDDPLANNLPERLYYIKKSLEYIMDYGRKNGIEHYVILGDVYHDKTIIYNTSQAMLLDFFKQYEDRTFYIISGNHDLSSTGENQKSAILALGELDNVHCFIKPAIINKNQLIQVDTPLFFVPYSGNFLDSIKNFKNIDPDTILFSHIGLNEAVLQSGLSRVDKLKLSDLKQFKLAILGHYHKPQDFGNDYTHVWYAGSLIPRDWNDKNEKKRFLVVDTITKEVQSVDIDCGVPQYIEIVIPPNSTADFIKSEMNRAKIIKSQGNKVRVINRNNHKLKEENTDIIILEQQQIDVTNRGITVDQSKLDQCKKYMEIKNIPEDEREEYLKVLNDSKLLEVIDT